jgi:hypothetical protein
MNLVIGSGDIREFLSGKHTKGFAKLLQKFVAFDKPYYNSFASPIDALRTGAILEQRYLQALTDDYYIQYKTTSKEFNCCTSTLDFAKFKQGELLEFDELKTIFLADYVNIVLPITKMSKEKQMYHLKKKFKANYNQVQFQLFTSGLEYANLVFLAVYCYDDETNNKRQIKKTDYVKFKVERDEEVISKIKERASFFQHIKDGIK